MTARALAGALLLTAFPVLPAAAQKPYERPEPRTLAQESLDKARVSLYQDHDCDRAARQASFGLNNSRHPGTAGPELNLILGKARTCMGHTADAAIAFANYEALSGEDPTASPELDRACEALLRPEGIPSDSVDRRAMIQGLMRQRRELHTLEAYPWIAQPVRVTRSSSTDNARYPRWSGGSRADVQAAYLREERERLQLHDRDWVPTRPNGRPPMAANEIDARLACIARAP